MKSHIPISLVYSRLVLGILILTLSIIKVENYGFIAVILLSIGLLTDVFDGIIARKLNVSTEKLRRLDSSVDQLFFLSYALATYFQYPDFFKQNSLTIIALLSTEVACYLLCFIRFRKEVATHSIGAKIWTLVLFATLIQLTLQGESTWLFSICFWLGMLTRIEILAIIASLKEWTNDVPSLYHALQLRKGKPIQRHKLFNG